MPGEIPGWFEGFAATTEDRLAAVALSTLIWMTPRRRVELASASGTASEVLRAVRAGRGGRSDAEHLDRVDPTVVEDAAVRAGARVIPIGTQEYPPQLLHLPDPPLVLFAIGPPPPGLARCVAIVGSRRCSALGREIATALGRGLARAGVAVVSGAARGIDAAAHDGAMAGGGGTIAVLGCGIDRPYPSRAFLERIRAAGSILSEFPPGTPPHPRHFPSRNRIVAGLSRATVVVEGAEGSGSLITAEHAMEFGRDVFAVAGAVTDPLAAAPLRLIREGAGAIRGVDDLLGDLGLEGDRDTATVARLTEEERTVLAALHGPTLAERVAAAMGANLVEVLPVLMRLELQGLVRSVGGRFEPTLRAVAAREG